MANKKPTTRDTVDTEGQGFRKGADEGDGSVDTEGNGFRFPADQVDGDEPEDTEGTEGNVFRH
jgi:hypothetical protein